MQGVGCRQQVCLYGAAGGSFRASFLFISEISPCGAPRNHLDPDNLKPGIWNVYPVHKGDHMSLQGGLLHKKDIRSFYTDMLTMISAAE